MQLFFCEHCGKRISDGEIARGKGRRVGQLAWCSDCVADAAAQTAAGDPGAETADSAHAASSPARARPPTPGRPRPGSSSRIGAARQGRRRKAISERGEKDDGRASSNPRAGTGSNITTVAVGVGLALGLLAGIVALMGGGSTPSRRPYPPSHPVSSPRDPNPSTQSVGISPTVQVTGPATGTAVAADGTVTITAKAADFDGRVTMVEFFDGDKKLGEVTAAPYRFEWTGVPQGEHRIVAKATDNSGRTAVSAPVVVTAGRAGAAPGP